MKFENLKNCIKTNWVINSDFECVIDQLTKEHKFISGAYYIECKNNKYSKDIQCFYNLEEYTRTLYSELKYIEEIEETYLNNPIDYTNFDEEKLKNTSECEHCGCQFDNNYNDRCIVLNEIVDKEKLLHIINNNDFNEEVNNLAKNYYESLDNFGRKRVQYKQKSKHKDRYYGIGSCLSYLKKEIRNSIMPKNIKDIDMINCHPVILLNLCQKNKVKCNILKNYVENRNIILESFGDNKRTIKELFLTILNGGFKKTYSENDLIQNYLKLLETEIFKIQNYFYSKDKRYLDKDYNYKGKNLSRIILEKENEILQTMINYFVSKRVNIFTLEYDGLKIYTDDKSKHFSINELEKIILKNTQINMKLCFKDIIDSFPEFGIRVSTDNIIKENVIENKKIVIHHDHAFERDNVISFICRECNLQIKNNYKIPLYFFNGSKYDFSIILNSLSKFYKDEISISCIGNSSEQYKSIEFKFKNMKYSFKLLDISNFIKGSLSELSEKLSDEHKIITKKHFPNNFELLKRKAFFPYEWLTEENIYNKELPPIENFYSSLKLQNIKQEQYDETLKIYKELKCKNVRDYLEIYMKLDVCLQADVFNVFRNIIWTQFGIDCCKYITSCSLSLDLMLKYTGAKIELFKDISMFDFTDASIIRGLCLASQNIADDNDNKLTISDSDVVSLYPYVMTQKLPISNYRFISKSNFNKNKYGQNMDHSCLMNVEIYTTKRVLNNKILSQFPALISKSKISYNELSEFQRKNLKENYKSSEKLVSHLGYDKNSYNSFEMYEMLKSLGYRINIKRVLEYKHSNFMKKYIDFCFEKKSYYKSIGDKNMSLTFKILLNLLFGVMMTRVQNFKDFKIITLEEQVNKLTSKPNFITRNIINEDLSILEMGKISVIYSYPILIGSIILQNSKVHMYNYLYKIYPKLFGNDYKILYTDTDSIYSKLNMIHEKYLEIVKDNSNIFGKNIGQLDSDHFDNKIKEAIFLSSKCYSFICEKDIPANENKLKNNIIHAKGISDAY